MADRVPPQFRHFFDDAAVFPPGRAPLDGAVRDHLRRRNTAYAPAVGPLLLDLADAGEAAALAADVAAQEGIDLTADPLRVSLVVPPGALGPALDTVRSARPHIVIGGLEFKTSAADWDDLLPAARTAAGVCRIHAELAIGQIRAGAVAGLAAGPVRLKFRTGGLEPELFPSCTELAEVITTAVSHQVPFKLTAGLHRAVRHDDPETGATHHGFLNIALATDRAMHGSTPVDVAAVLEERDGAVLAGFFRRQPSDWRTFFESFGTCSVLEPAESLTALELLPAGLPEAAAPRTGDPRS